MKSFAVIALVFAAFTDAKSRGTENANEVSMTTSMAKNQFQEVKELQIVSRQIELFTRTNTFVVNEFRTNVTPTPSIAKILRWINLAFSWEVWVE